MVGKDLNTIWNRKGIRALLMAMPVLLVVVLPLVYFAAISLLPVADSAKPPEGIQALLPPETSQHGYRQFWMDAFTTLVCPALFLAVPIVCSVAAASCAFVSEKENGTLETLFLSSMAVKSVFNAKITVCALISTAISLISFIVFTITISVADIMISAPYFFSVDWLVIVILLTPSLALFSVIFVSLLLPRVHSMGESLQTMGYLILPFLLLYLAQFAGVFRIGPLFLIVLSVLLVGLSIILFNVSSRKFQVETLLADSAEDRRGA